MNYEFSMYKEKKGNQFIVRVFSDKTMAECMVKTFHPKRQAHLVPLGNCWGIKLLFPVQSREHKPVKKTLQERLDEFNAKPFAKLKQSHTKEVSLSLEEKKDLITFVKKQEFFK